MRVLVCVIESSLRSCDSRFRREIPLAGRCSSTAQNSLAPGATSPASTDTSFKQHGLAKQPAAKMVYALVKSVETNNKPLTIARYSSRCTHARTYVCMCDACVSPRNGRPLVALPEVAPVQFSRLRTRDGRTHARVRNALESEFVKFCR